MHVLIPAGPDTVEEYLADTIDSINHHIGIANCVVAIIDDSQGGRIRACVESLPKTLVLTPSDTSVQRSTRGSLFMKQASVLRQLVRQYSFDILLRLDTDALLTGDAPHEDVLAFLQSRPDVGMVGAFKRRGDGSDKTLAMVAKGREITREMRLSAALRDFALVRQMRRLVKRAERHGYTRGDMCTGGALFFAPAALREMDRQGMFELDAFNRSHLMDDTILALLCCAAGYRLSDLPEASDILAVNWRGLPMPLDAIVSRNKKVLHPVKTEDAAMEPLVRAYFRHHRRAIRQHLQEHRDFECRGRGSNPHGPKATGF
jgi:hypothetical protein